MLPPRAPVLDRGLGQFQLRSTQSAPPSPDNPPELSANPAPRAPKDRPLRFMQPHLLALVHPTPPQVCPPGPELRGSGISVLERDPAPEGNREISKGGAAGATIASGAGSWMLTGMGERGG